MPTQDKMDTLVKVINDPDYAYSNYLPNAPAGVLNLPGKSILNAMNRSADTYKSRSPDYSNHSGKGYELIEACLKTPHGPKDGGPTHWSDITLHYYCQMSLPRYCYSGALADKIEINGTKTKIAETSRAEAYQGCINGTLPASEKFAWVANDQALIFQYVMFEQTNAFKHDQEQAIINAFYGAKTHQIKQNVRKNLAEMKTQMMAPIA